MTTPTVRDDLLARVRDALRAEPSVREIRMFGGTSFMVEERMVVNVRRDGRLLVRVDPARSDTLIADHGARRARMGERDMGAGWLDVVPEHLTTDEALAFWIATARAYTGRRPAR